MAKNATQWWRFLDRTEEGVVTGEFESGAAERMGRLYFPIVNEAGMLSWVTPQLQGSPSTGHNEYLGMPLTAEDLPHTLAHRGFWLVESDREPFSLSAISPQGLGNHLRRGARSDSRVTAGPGWLRVGRQDPEDRFEVSATLWAPADLDERIEVMLVEVVNNSRSSISFLPYAAIPLFARSADNVRDHRHVTALLHRASLQDYGVTVRPTMTFDERGHKLNRMEYTVLGVGPRGKEPAGIWAAQEQFLGEGGNYAVPSAVWNFEQAPRVQQIAGHEAIGGFRFPRVTLKGGARAQFVLVSGISSSPKASAQWLRWARNARKVAASLEFTKKYWLKQIGRVAFRSPDARFNNWMTWVNFQPMLRRFYGNSFLPQFDYGRGGRGWRDLWQDRLAQLLSDPESVRPALVHNFGGVRIDGSNATIIGKDGTFIADRNNIPRTWMDHGIWPTHTALMYIDQTGDIDFLLQEREYFRDPQTFRCRRLDRAWTESYGYALRTHKKAVYRGTILEHLLVQNLTAFFNVGEHNVCRMEGADWNDGLDMAEHRGESVAFTAFYAWNLMRLADIVCALACCGHKRFYVAEELGLLLDRLPGKKPVAYASARAKTRRLAEYIERVAGDVSGRKIGVSVEDLAGDLVDKYCDLAARVRKQEWVKAGASAFFNGYYDDRGIRVEGRRGRDVRMTLTGQVFPLMAGIANDEQVDRVVKSVNQYLRDPKFGGLRLNTDFGSIQPALGRAFSFAYGEKENGAVFSHMVIMYAYALYLRRRAAAGREAWHTLYEKAVDSGTSKIFPCLPEYFNGEGRGMYCYLTGSASWLVYLLLTQVYGLRGELGDLVIDPQLMPADFDAAGRAGVKADFAGRTLAVTYLNPEALKPGQYVVGRIACRGTPVPFKAGKAGGVRVDRTFLRKAPAGAVLPLEVGLVSKRAG